MKIFFSPFTTLFAKSVLYKNGILIPVSTFISVGLEVMTNVLNTNFLGVSTSFLILISFMFVFDFWTGVRASSFEQGKAIEAGNEEEAKDKKFNSSKITFTFFKFIMLFLWIWLADSMGEKVEAFPIFNTTYAIITTVPLILVTLREYISIGENIERKYGKKPYIFILVEKIFDALQLKFINKIGDED